MSGIAVVEDDSVVSALLVAILEDRGYEVRTFTTKAEAFAALVMDAPDLMIVDVGLPDGSGLDLVGALRARIGRKPAIVLSGNHQETDYVRAFAAGAVDFMGKPFNKAELLARCAIHLARNGESFVPEGVETDLPEHNGLTFGRYKIRCELGRGGYGRVYLARDEVRGKDVALKVLGALANEQQEVKLRFIRETYALKSVAGPGIVEVYDVGCEQGRLYYSMEYVKGVSLGDRVRRTGVLKENEATTLVRSLLAPLANVARSGLVHRDLKPENIILRDGRVDQPMLIDFGLAKMRSDHGVTQGDVIMGTLGYLAPEVITGATADARSDLFALGLTIRYALTRHDVFPGLNGIDLMRAIVQGPIPLPEGLSKGFSVFLSCLLSVDPEMRPPSARAALELLDVVLASNVEGSGDAAVVTVAGPAKALTAEEAEHATELFLASGT